MLATDEVTRHIIGCCFKVHNALGPGFPEKIYQAALAISLEEQGLAVERERRFAVYFDGNIVGEFRVDVLIEHCVILEVKAVTGVMPKVFRAQLLAYLKAANIPAGLLVNFGNRGCDVKRLTFSVSSDLSTDTSDLSTMVVP